MARPAWHHDKRSSSARGYGAAWRKLRLLILQRDSYLCQCEDCRRLGLVKLASHVDHIVSKAEWERTRGTLEGVDNPENLRALHADCHARKSIEEKGHQIRPDIGPDGYPLER